MLGKKISAILLSTALIGGCTATAQPIVLEDQGSFMAGGKTITAKGTFDAGQPMNEAGQTLHGDHAYVFYQKPVHAKANGIVFLHGYGQS